MHGRSNGKLWELIGLTVGRQIQRALVDAGELEPGAIVAALEGWITDARIENSRAGVFVKFTVNPERLERLGIDYTDQC